MPGPEKGKTHFKQQYPISESGSEMGCLSYKMPQKNSEKFLKKAATNWIRPYKEVQEQNNKFEKR